MSPIKTKEDYLDALRSDSFEDAAKILRNWIEHACPQYRTDEVEAEVGGAICHHIINIQQATSNQARYQQWLDSHPGTNPPAYLDKDRNAVERAWDFAANQFDNIYASYCRGLKIAEEKPKAEDRIREVRARLHKNSA